MRGFAIVAGMYAGLWALFLAPGALLMLRRAPARPLPADAVSDTAWVRATQRRLAGRAERVRPSDVPVAEAPRRRGRLPSGDDRVLHVAGDLAVPDGALVPCALIVAGDLQVGASAVLAGPVWVRGSVSLAEGAWTAAALIADADADLGPKVQTGGGVAAGGTVRLAEEARVAGPAVARRAIELAPAARVDAALAPVVRGAPLPDDAGEVAPRSRARPLEEMEWTAELDAALEEIWPQGRLAELVEAIYERTGETVRGVHIMRRARELGLYAQGLPRRPRVLGKKPAWVLTAETIRVGADLRVPPGGTVSYSMVVEGALEVFEDAQLEAPVRSGRGLLLRTGAVVYAQVASDGLIVCEEGSAVLGPMDSSTHILLFANARVGVRGFGGAHAIGAIGLEPGAQIVGGAVAGLGVRGEPLRPPTERVDLRGKRRRRSGPVLVPAGEKDMEGPSRGGRRRARRPEAPEAP